IEKAAVQARKLVHHESVGDLITIYQSGDLEGKPIGLVESYADCDDDGTLTLLFDEHGIQYNNWKAGSPVSFDIKSSSFPFFQLLKPRLSLQGLLSVVDSDSDNNEKLAKCFLHRHPFQKSRLPGNFYKFNVTDVYLLGDSSQVVYIGDIPVDLYKNVTLPKPH
ncbi:pyridoxamine 5'-phosphate oxidase-domain-containing protein, partial [Lipomyces japonicus]|uniref:pyridoxamine 5'-phosphate oxidase-domain-containing protein n=1 Tax=Lipomyces japonicus TaxID=56871 RepID=UPI0034CF23EB